MRTAFVLFLGTLVLYAIGLGDAPVYLHDAEIQFALHADAIARTAHDANGRFLPLYFQMPAIGANVWFHPFLVYLTAPFLWLLPLSEQAVRFPTAVLAAVNVWLTYLVAERIFRRRDLAFVSAVMMALTPAHFIHGRVAMDYLHPVPFILGWLWCLLRFEHTKSPWMLFAGALSLGLGVYSYIASIVMMPIYLACTLLYLAAGTRTSSPTAYLACLAGFAIPLLPGVVWLIQHAAVVSETLERYGSPGTAHLTFLQKVREYLNYNNVQEKISVFWEFFNPAYLFFAGGSNLINSTRAAGVFSLPLAVFLPVGIYAALTERRTRASVLIVFGFLSAPFAATLVGERYAVDRELGILPFAILLAGYGVAVLLAPTTPRVWRLAGAVLLVLIPIHFAYFWKDYFTDYPLRSAAAFNSNNRGAVEAVLSYRPTAESVYVSRSLPYIREYWRFYQLKAGLLDAPSPVSFDAATFDATAIPSGSVVVAHVQDSAVRAAAEAALLKPIAQVPELGGPPIFALYRR